MNRMMERIIHRKQKKGNNVIIDKKKGQYTDGHDRD